ncbi:hypothetical protein G7Y79_00011g029740 [Physcia stellaris]|nr:hypothetical protein G7Y79_00011g029740 [Physcia stellaris]
MTEFTDEASKPPAKRALFKKPTWSRPQNLASPADFFHRSNSASVDPVLEAERKRKAKAAKKEAEKASQKAEEQRAEKRQRVSKEEDDDLYGRSQYFYEWSAEKQKVDPKAITQPLDIIDLEDSDDDEVLVVAQARKPPPPEEDDFPVSDEEYADLARKAREKARRKRLEDDVLIETRRRPPSIDRDSQSQRHLPTHISTPPPASLDPEVHILITSRLDNASPLIIKRRLSQRLKDVRLHWCSHNQFTDEMASTIFLTWRGKRLFDVTSCKSLGIAVDKDGRVMAKEQDDILAEEERKIHMEAMTKEIYEACQKARRQVTEQQDGDYEEEELPVQQKPPEDQVRLILKAKGFNDFKLIAKPATTIARMIAGFRKANPAGTENREVFIVFDGDRLEPEITVSETELSDLDEVDVYPNVFHSLEHGLFSGPQFDLTIDNGRLAHNNQ